MGLSYGHSESYIILDILTSLTLINFSSADLIDQFSRKLKATNPKTCADVIHDTDTYLVYPPSRPTIRCAMCDVQTPRLTYVYLVRINSRDGDTGSRSGLNTSIERDNVGHEYNRMGGT